MCGSVRGGLPHSQPEQLRRRVGRLWVRQVQRRHRSQAASQAGSPPPEGMSHALVFARFY